MSDDVSTSLAAWRQAPDGPAEGSLGGLRDDALLRRIAEESCREAFAELYRRYAKPAYDLACVLAGDPQEAADCMQVGMLAVWHSAKKYRPANPRGWILRIIAVKTLGRKREKGRRQRLEGRLPRTRPGDTLAGGFSGAADKREEIACLKRHLAALPVRDQQFLELYFAQSLSQDEIGQLLGFPQNTVSYRIQQSLATLRARLKSDGFAAVGALEDLLAQGPAGPAGPPPAIWETLCRSLAPGSPPAGALPSTASNGSLFQRLLWPALGLAAAAAVLVGWAGGGPRQEPGLHPGLETSSAGAATEGPDSPSGFHRRWSFERKGETAGLDFKSEGWHHRSSGGAGDSGCLAIHAGQPLLMGFAIPEDRLPVKVSAWVLQTKSSWPCAIDLFSFPARFSTLVDHRISKVSKRLENRVTWVVTKDIISETVDGEPRGLRMYGRTSDLLLLRLEGIERLDELEIATLSWSEVPDFTRYREAVADLAPEMRRGTVPLYGLPSASPPLPMTAEFFEGHKLLPPSRLERHWRFDTPTEPRDLYSTAGSWQFQPAGPEEGGFMRTGPGRTVIELDLPDAIAQRPLRLTWRERIAPGQGALRLPCGQVQWRLGGNRVLFDPESHLAPAPATSSAQGQPEVWTVCVCYVSEFIDLRVAGRRFHLERIDPVGKTNLTLAFEGSRQVDDLRIEQAGPGELPDYALERPFLARLRTIERRTGFERTGCRMETKGLPGVRQLISLGNGVARTE